MTQEVYARKVEIGEHWDNIRNYVLNIIGPNRENIISKNFTLNDVDFMRFIYNELKEPLEAIGFKNTIPKSVILFGVKANTTGSIHVDGFSLERKNASNFAINIPIENCDLGVMNWYGGEYFLSETKTKEDLMYLKLNWKEEPKVVYSEVINSPTIVKVNIPHNVENMMDKHRLILSIRYVPDLGLSW